MIPDLGALVVGLWQGGGILPMLGLLFAVRFGPRFLRGFAIRLGAR